MKKITITILSVLIIQSTHLLAKPLDGKSKINEVTVFKNWAFVKRVKSFKLKKGSYSIPFHGVTPTLDKDSLKAKVKNKNAIQILGIRNKVIYKKREDNAKLNKLYKKEEELKKKMRKIQASVVLLLKESGDLGRIRGHYRESFTLNLHEKKWSNKSFKQFFKFIDKRSTSMHGKWKKAYSKYQKLDESKKFVQVKINELRDVADEKDYNVYVDVAVTKNIENSIELQYLVRNVGWSPVYDLRIKSIKGVASLEQYAYVWQNTGEDWKNVKMIISNNRAELKVNPPSISSYTLSYREVKKVKTVISSTTRDQEALIASIPLGQEGGEDIFKSFKVPKRQTILTNSPKSKVYLHKVKVPYYEHLELVAKQYPRVFKKGKLRNAFAWAMAAGNLYIYYDGSFLQSIYLNYVPKGKDFYINAGIDYSLISKRHTSTDTDMASIIGSKNEYKKKFYISVMNHSKNIKNVKIVEQVPHSETKEIEVSTDGSTKGFKKLIGKPSWIYWNAKILPRKNSYHELNVKVSVPKDFRFNW